MLSLLFTSLVRKMKIAMILLMGAVGGPSLLSADEAPSTPSTSLTTAPNEAPSPVQAETRSIMDQIFSSMITVLPLSMDSKAFSDPQHRDQILSELRKIRESTSSLVEHTKKFDGSYGYIAKSMARDLKDIYSWYDKGAYSEAQYLLQQVSENCVSCHMKLPDPGHAPKMDTFFKNVSIAKLSAPEKARLQVALRQFDDALVTWEEMFRTWPKASELFAMDAMPEYLKVVLRVKHQPKRAAQTLSQISKRADLPKFMGREVSAWKVSLNKTGGELLKSGRELERAKNIMASAKRTMEYPMDRVGLIDFIVASGLLNQHLQSKSLKPNDIAESYYLLGVTEVLIGRGTWLTQSDYYLEAAIRAAPKSPAAGKAIDALEQQVLTEYSGSGGTNVPEDVKNNLDELRRLVSQK